MNIATPQPAIIFFTQSSKKLAENIAVNFAGKTYYCSAGGQDAKPVLHKLFLAKNPIIGICATGILVRLLAPVLVDKHDEPPVISVSSEGDFVIPVLGGHHGANQLAKEISQFLGGVAAITTASDVPYRFALDAPPQGYILANPQAAKSAMVALLNGKNMRVFGEHDWLENAGYPITKDGEVLVRVSEKVPDEHDLQQGPLFHPKTLIIGVGCARHTPKCEIIDLVEKILGQANLAPQSIAAFASIDIKSDETGLLEAAEHFAVPIRFFPAQVLAEQSHRVPNPSSIVEAETGTASVAEAAAILAGELIVEKQKTKPVTCAIGKSKTPLDIDSFGQAPGQLHLVGIGPGEAAQRTQSATLALNNATDWVGYGLYLDLVEDLHFNQTRHRFELGDEEPRVRFALELAAKGKKVALVCSGDAQIYAMAALVFELLDVEGKRAVSAGARRVFVESHPGISALQTASARAGALLGHDFCTISLSDLLTPRADIENRLLAAAKGDFVTAFYNPRSKKRTDLIEIAKQTFLRYRPGGTPVVIASNLGRKGEDVRVVTLNEFDPEEIDMLTIVLFGSSNSKAFKRGNAKTIAFTPRGYANKKGIG